MASADVWFLNPNTHEMLLLTIENQLLFLTFVDPNLVVL